MKIRQARHAKSVDTRDRELDIARTQTRASQLPTIYAEVGTIQRRLDGDLP